MGPYIGAYVETNKEPRGRGSSFAFVLYLFSFFACSRSLPVLVPCLFPFPVCLYVMTGFCKYHIPRATGDALRLGRTQRDGSNTDTIAAGVLDLVEAQISPPYHGP